MPHPLPTESVCFVFAPALYPNSPLEGKPVFVHGKILETKQRNGEWIARCADEKGEWETYLKTIPSTRIENGETVWGFGLVERQPDGKTMLAARWVKKTSENEYAYCMRATNNQWPNLLQTHPEMEKLVPYVAPVVRERPTQPFPKAAQPSEPDEFVSASELKIERDFV